MATRRRKTVLLSGLLALTALTGYGQQQQDAAGTVLLEQWNVSGSAISSLTNPITNPAYPHQPAHRDNPHSLELVSTTAVPQGENYGTRFRGYLTLPAAAAGTYTFYIAGDDNAELYLSTTDNPANATLIASATNTGLRTYTQFPSQKSVAKTLAAGQRYYIEVRHKQGMGSSHVSVAWQLGTAPIVPVNGNYLSAFQVASGAPATANVLDNLTTAHPRVLGSALTFARAKARILVDGSASDISFGTLEKAAVQLLSAPVIVKPTTNDEAVKRSRFITERVRLLAFVYRLSNEADKDKYKNRAWLELENIISNSPASPAWSNWNPRGELLDVAELTTAAAIGYDWLYTALDTTQRGKLRRAILTKGLKVGLGQYNAQNTLVQQQKRSGWSNQPYNWNAVCNAGFTMGALAIAGKDDSTPAVNANTNAKAREVLGHVLRTLPLGVSDFAPDGGWDEGPGYWDYTTSRLVNLFSTTEAALGSTFGLADKPGLAQTGLFVPYINRPSKVELGLTFNHSDGNNTLGAKPQLLWMANRYNQPLYASLRNKAVDNETGGSSSLTELDLLWYNAHYAEGDVTSLPLDRRFVSSQVALLRSAWGNTALSVGLKAGNNQEGHEQLDIGTFVLDAGGYAWAEELGNDDYGLTNYFRQSKPTGTNAWPATPYRYDYYRIRAEGQNTLLVNPVEPGNDVPIPGPDQTSTLDAPITRFETNTDEAFAVADLQEAYAGKVTKALRGIRLFERRTKVLIQDEIETPANATIWWQMHTRATIGSGAIRDAGKSILLEQGGKWLLLRIVSGPDKAVFTVDTDPKLLVTNPAVTGQKSLGDNLSKIYIKMSGVTHVQLAVLAVPLPTAVTTGVVPPTIVPLSQWGQDLTVTAVTASPAVPAVGQPVTFSATIRNNGTMPTPAVQHSVAFKVDGVVVNWSRYHVSALAPGQEVTLNADGGPNGGSSTWPATVGHHTLTAEVDDTGLIAETNETNNLRTSPLTVGAPDLQVQHITWSPAAPVAGQPVVFSATFKNIGTMPTPAVQHDVSFLVDNAEVSWSTAHVGALAPGAEVTVTATGGVANGTNTWVATAGSHQVKVVLDDANTIAESDETNNAATSTLAVSAVDLVLTTLSATPAAPAVGQPVTFSATIRNNGTTTSPAGVKHGVAFKVDGVVVSWGSTYNAMAPGTDVLITAAGGPNAGASTWPATGGSHTVTAEVDDTRLIAETDETNNLRTMTLNIGATVGPVHDAYVRAGSFATTAHGTTTATIDATKLLTKHNDVAEYEREAYLTFSLDNLPGPVSSARLRLYKGVTAAPASTIAVGAYSVAAPTWTETALTWGTKPTPSATALVTTDAPAAAGYIEWDVTSYVAAQKSQGQSAVGFALKNIPSAAETLVWNSKEAATDRPQLVLGFGAAARGILATSPATTSPAGHSTDLTLYPNPAQNALTVELTSATAHPVSIRLTSALGRVVQHLTPRVPAGHSRHTLDTSHLANGLYLLTVQQGPRQTTRKVVIAH